jgi:hypothetical protein
MMMVISDREGKLGYVWDTLGHTEGIMNMSIAYIFPFYKEKQAKGFKGGRISWEHILCKIYNSFIISS